MSKRKELLTKVFFIQVGSLPLLMIAVLKFKQRGLAILTVPINRLLLQLQQLQQQQLVNITNRSISAAATLSTKISSVISGDYSFNYLGYKSESQLTKRGTVVRIFNQKISFSYFPIKNVLFRIGAEHYTVFNSFSSAKKYFFCDFSTRYKLNKSRFDFELFCQNLFDTRKFTPAFIINNIQTVSVLQIRPRQVLVKANFSF